MSSLTYFAKGGGCFLAGTQILVDLKEQDMATAFANIEDLKAGDEIVSLNETTGKQQLSTIEKIDKLVSESYYIINDNVQATGEHPFYTTDGIKKVSELQLGDVLRTMYGDETVHTLQFVQSDVVIYNLINVEPNHNYYADGYLVHNKGGGGGHASSSHASVSHTSTSSKSSPSSSKASPGSTKSTTSTTKSAPAKPAAPKTSAKAGTSKAKPGSTIKTADGKVIKTSTAKPTNAKYNKSVGVVGDNGYTPRFTSGYQAPAGSVVYYQNHSALDYLPWIYLFSQDHSPAPSQQTATVVQPDGKQVVAKPVAGGTDGLAILNWIILIIIVGAIVAGIVALVNKLTTKHADKAKENW